MNEQLIAQLQLLIELAKTGKEFLLKNRPSDISFRISKVSSIQVKVGSGEWRDVEGFTFNELLNYTIIRKPWKPKVGESYWTWIDGKFSGEYCVSRSNFNCAYDLQSIAFGNCFRTKEECESHTEIRDKLIAMRKEYE